MYGDDRKREARRRLPLTSSVALITLAAWLAAAGPAPAYDDDIDYGAPYITVEDGKLVTKDPKKHPATKPGHPSTPPSAPASTPDAAPARQQSDDTAPSAAQHFSPLSAGMLAAGLAVVLILVVLVRRGSRPGQS